MRCLLISDIHANLFALQSVLSDAEGSYDVVWCLGDIVGYGPFPNECVELISELGGICVAGNHDWAALEKINMSDFNTDAQSVLLWTKQQLSDANYEFLDNLKVTAVHQEFTLVHGSPRHPIWEYVLQPSVAQANFDFFGTRFCLVGHTHSAALFPQTLDAELAPGNGGLPESRTQPLGPSRFILNPGSVGQPRDGDARANYVVLDLDQQAYEHRLVDYPVHQTQERMTKLGFPPRLINRLTFGW